MPQAVAKFAATRDLEAVDSVKRDILALYCADIQKYGGVLRHNSIVSLDKFRAKYRRFLDVPYVLHPKDLKVSDGVTYLPLYMASLLVACGRT